MAPKRIAFYAPMKSPHHLVPSGDRAMARGVMAALSGMSSKPSVDLVSEFRTRDGKGDSEVQRQILKHAEHEITRILGQPEASCWQVWVTYHSYYKAPDLLGPTIAKALHIPYIQIEASRSPKQLHGPWSLFAANAEAACDAADCIFYMTERDKPALISAQKDPQILRHLPPFLNETRLPPLAAFGDDIPILLAVGMMRNGDKLASYRVLAEALLLCKTEWVLHIVGDGPALAKVIAIFEPLGPRVRFLGQLSREQVADQMAHANLFVWPGVNEAFGMVYLEAQSHGLTVVAQNRPGVRDVVGTGSRLVAPKIPQEFAAAVDDLLLDDNSRQTGRKLARNYVASTHLLPAASNLLEYELTRLMEGWK